MAKPKIIDLTKFYTGGIKSIRTNRLNLPVGITNKVFQSVKKTTLKNMFLLGKSTEEIKQSLKDYNRIERLMKKKTYYAKREIKKYFLSSKVSNELGFGRMYVGNNNTRYFKVHKVKPKLTKGITQSEDIKLIRKLIKQGVLPKDFLKKNKKNLENTIETPIPTVEGYGDTLGEIIENMGGYERAIKEYPQVIEDRAERYGINLESYLRYVMLKNIG